jgi:hypothetical protein
VKFDEVTEVSEPLAKFSALVPGRVTTFNAENVATPLMALTVVPVRTSPARGAAIEALIAALESATRLP